MTFVLVVEDEESISDALAYMLRKEGFEVAVCPTGPDALAAFDRNGADLCAARHHASGASWHRSMQEPA
jgi:two-component system, OmpR family, response regulator RegX3